MDNSGEVLALAVADGRESLVAIARALYPQPGVGDGPYQRAAEYVLAAAERDPRLWHILRDGLGELTIQSTPLASLPESAVHDLLAQRTDTEFFREVRSLVAFVFYDDREVWDAVGYPGASFDKGGYVLRGFDDLNWLPEPRIEESGEARVEIGPLSYAIQTAKTDGQEDS